MFYHVFFHIEFNFFAISQTFHTIFTFIIFDSDRTHPVVSVSFVQINVYNMLFYRHEVKSTAVKSTMVLIRAQ